MAENGGPKVSAGLRDELLAEKMSLTLSKLTPTDMFTDDAAQRIAEIERKELLLGLVHSLLHCSLQRGSQSLVE